MRLIAIHIGKPREVEWRGKLVSTGIFKEPVQGPVRVRKFNLEGDGQADLEVHGGEHKAIYSYTHENYEWWNEQLPEKNFVHGNFGENLTIEGMDETEVCVGDRIQIGAAILEAAQQRMPCFKLGIRLSDDSMVKTFLDAGRWGIYWRVEKEGVIQARDEVVELSKHEARVRIYELPGLTRGADPNLARVKALLAIPTLCPRIRARLLRR